MKIFQIVSSLLSGDAVGNNVLAIKDILLKSGYETGIYAMYVDSRLSKNSARCISDLKNIRYDDVLIYHMAIGSELSYWIINQKCHKIMIYHNITPPKFYKEYDFYARKMCEYGLKEVQMLKDQFDVVFADSEFNKNDLFMMGYKCPIEVLPIIIAFEDYLKEPNNLILKKYSDDITNIIFVGRIVPNKKQEDIIQAYYYYKKYYNSKSRLILVGSYNKDDLYYLRLQKYIDYLNLKDVIFTGRIHFDEILAFYKIADVFVCQSEHEGFCVPLIEAMFFSVPIVAYDSCAVKDTLAGSGFLMKDKDGIKVAGAINQIMRNLDLKNIILNNQKERLEYFSKENISNLFKQHLLKYLKNI